MMGGKKITIKTTASARVYELAYVSQSHHEDIEQKYSRAMILCTHLKF